MEKALELNNKSNKIPICGILFSYSVDVVLDSEIEQFYT